LQRSKTCDLDFIYSTRWPRRLSDIQIDGGTDKIPLDKIPLLKAICRTNPPLTTEHYCQ